jgi:hypothetical protein
MWPRVFSYRVCVRRLLFLLLCRQISAQTNCDRQPLPVCGSNQFVRCENGKLSCIDCTNQIPSNSIYFSAIMATDRVTCSFTTCSPGSYANSPKDLTCTQCPILFPLPPNARWRTTADTPLLFCLYECNDGYYMSWFDCIACPLPYDAVPLPGLPWGSTNDPGCRNFGCKPGTYLQGPHCSPCPTDTYRNSISKAGCTNCYAAGQTNGAQQCSTGFYAMLSKTDCSLMVCDECNAVSNSFFVLENGLSAGGEHQCYTRECPPAKPGTQLTGCGGWDTGILNECVDLLIWNPSGDAFDNTLLIGPPRYYVNGCETAACAPCTEPNRYNALCPAQNAVSLSAGNCDTTCVPPNINNGYYTVREADAPPVANNVTCPFVCNLGYYAPSKNASVGCVPCPTSDQCPIGKYLPGCCEPYQTLKDCLDFKCRTCEPYGPLTTSMFTWRQSYRSVGGAQSCRYECNAGFFKPENIKTCTLCSNANCPIGYVRVGECLIASGATVDSTCVACNSVLNANLTSFGRTWNNQSSCDFTCNAGYFATSGRCVPWTPSPASPCTPINTMYWGGGTAWRDHYCATCPNPPARNDGVVYLNGIPCSWTCGGGYALGVDASCTQCQQGTFKNFVGPGPCAVCPEGTYQNNRQATQCLALPANSRRVGSGFECLPSFRLDLFAPSTCTACVAGASNLSEAIRLSNMLDATWDTNCAITAFTCNLGHYRAINPLPSCVLCPNVNNALPGGSTMRPVAVCGAYPSCPSVQDEITTACPPTTTGCVSGFYPQAYRPSNDSREVAIRCEPCVDEICPAGKTQAACQGSTVNQCRECTGRLGDLQVWTATTCNITCVYGYFFDAGSKTCTACLKGKYQPLAIGLGCVDCGTGTYAPINGMSTCNTCPAGTYASNGFGPIASGAIQCDPCAQGKFGDQGGRSTCATCTSTKTYAPSVGLTACSPCPAETPNSVSDRSACVPPSPPSCPAGFFLFNTTTCVGCPEGTYCAAGVTVPTICPAGTPPAPRLSGAVSDCSITKHVAGRRILGSAPAPCPANTTTYGRTGATSAAWCYPKPGFYGAPGAAATPCPYDMYCPTPAFSAIACPPIAPFGPFMSTSSANCTPTMRPPCRPGYFMLWNEMGGGTLCRQCTSGSYCPGHVLRDGTPVAALTPSGSNILACPTPNPSGMWYSPPGAHRLEDCVAKPITVTKQVECFERSGATDGSYSLTDKTQCRANMGCYWLPGDTEAVASCPLNHYCPSFATEPTPCKTATSCAPGHKIIKEPCKCTSGFCQCGNADYPTCEPCTGISIANPAYWSSNQSECAVCCPSNHKMLQSNQNGNTAYSCESINPSTCPSGEYMPSTPACASVAARCQSCTNFSASGMVPMQSHASRFDIDACQYACAQGRCRTGLATFPLTWSDANAFECILAGPGTYATSQGVCLPCPTGTYMATSGATACLVCPPGSSNGTTTACVCAPNTFVRYTADLRQSCVACPIGMVWNATLGSCATCAPGTTWAPLDVMAQNTPCGAGAYRPTPRSACVACDLGTYMSSSSLAEGATACVACPPGTYAGTRGATACTQCGDKQYSSVSGASGCRPCMGLGTFSVWHNGTRCTCAAGEYLQNNMFCVSCNCSVSNSRVVGCATPGDDAFVCECAVGFTGDGAQRCERCAAQNSSDCRCNRGTYFANGTCRPCRSTCPGMATLNAPCPSGSLVDTTRCVCPYGWYFRWNDCYPCSRCVPNAKRSILCSLGATTDSTRCECPVGQYGNGITCASIA